MRVLVVEDEQDLADAVALGLRADGYAVDVAYDAEAALGRLGARPYDVVCLDLSLPRGDGREICRMLRDGRIELEDADGAVTAPPRVLMLTARDALEDRVAGLDDGADDYLVKPFELAELRARVRALLRRGAGRSGSTIRVGGLEIDTARHAARLDERPLALTPKEFALLRYFASRPGQVLSEGTLLRHVWDENANPFTKTVRVTVATLRRKLAEAGDQPIETVVGVGYRLREPA